MWCASLYTSYIHANMIHCFNLEDKKFNLKKPTALHLKKYFLVNFVCIFLYGGSSGLKWSKVVHRRQRDIGYVYFLCHLKQNFISISVFLNVMFNILWIYATHILNYGVHDAYFKLFLKQQNVWLNKLVSH